MLSKLFLIALLLIFSNQSFAFIEQACESSLADLIPGKSAFIVLFVSGLSFVLIRSVSALVKVIFHRSKEWMVFLFFYILYFSIDYYLFSIKENANLFTLSKSYVQYFLEMYNDLIILLSVLYIYIMSVLADMPIAKRVWVNWKVKIAFIIILIVGHLVGYWAAYLEQCNDYFSHGIGPLFGYNLLFMFISVLISLKHRANTLLILALSGSFYNLILLVDYSASKALNHNGFLDYYDGFFVTMSALVIYSLYFCFALFCTKRVKLD